MAKKVIKSEELKSRQALETKVREVPSGHAKVPLVRGIGSVLNKNVIDAQEQAGEVIVAAEAQAAKIRAEAETLLKEVEVAREEAKKRGYSEGREEGLASVTEAAAKLAELKEMFYTGAEEEIIKLVTTMAEKVIGRLMEEHRELVHSVVRQAIQASIGDRIVVRLHPDDYKEVSDDEGAFKDLLDRTRRIHFKEDNTITQGGCVVETEVGTIDAQLETQLEAIRKAFDL